MSAYSAVVFDLDDTLCVHDQDVADLWATAFDEAGVDPVLDPEDASAVDVGGLPVAETRQEFYENLFAAAAEDAGVDPDQATVEIVAEAYVDAHDPAAVSFREGAREALSAASEVHDMALVTNGGEATQTAKLEALGIADIFDVAVYCDPAAGVEPKPDPAPFLTALSELGVDPQEAIKVGNDHAADVVGAHNAGLGSAWVPLEVPVTEPDPTPTYVFDSMTDVAALFRE